MDLENVLRFLIGSDGTVSIGRSEGTKVDGMVNKETGNFHCYFKFYSLLKTALKFSILFKAQRKPKLCCVRNHPQL